MHIPAIWVIRIGLAIGSPAVNDTVACSARRAIGRSAANGWRGSRRVNTGCEWYWTCGGGEGVGELAICVADALLAYGLVVLLHAAD